MQAATQVLLARWGLGCRRFYAVRFAGVVVLACSCTGVSVEVPAQRAQDAATAMQRAVDAGPPDAAEPTPRADAAVASTSAPNAPAAQDAGPRAAADAGNPSPPAACHFDEPLQKLSAWRDDHGTVLKRIPGVRGTLGLGSDAQTGFWLLSGSDGSWVERGRVQSGAPVRTGLVGNSVALYPVAVLIGAPGEGGGSLFDLPLAPAACR